MKLWSDMHVIKTVKNKRRQQGKDEFRSKVPSFAGVFSCYSKAGSNERNSYNKRRRKQLQFLVESGGTAHQ